MASTTHEEMHDTVTAMLKHMTAAEERCAKAYDLHAWRHDDTYLQFVLEELARVGEEIARTQRWLSTYAVNEFGMSFRGLAQAQAVGHTTVRRWVRETSLDENPLARESQALAD